MTGDSRTPAAPSPSTSRRQPPRSAVSSPLLIGQPSTRNNQLFLPLGPSLFQAQHSASMASPPPPPPLSGTSRTSPARTPLRMWRHHRSLSGNQSAIQELSAHRLGEPHHHSRLIWRTQTRGLRYRPSATPLPLKSAQLIRRISRLRAATSASAPHRPMRNSRSLVKPSQVTSRRRLPLRRVRLR